MPADESHDVRERRRSTGHAAELRVVRVGKQLSVVGEESPEQQRDHSTGPDPRRRPDPLRDRQDGPVAEQREPRAHREHQQGVRVPLDVLAGVEVGTSPERQEFAVAEGDERVVVDLPPAQRNVHEVHADDQNPDDRREVLQAVGSGDRSCALFRNERLHGVRLKAGRIDLGAGSGRAMISRTGGAP